MKNLKIFISILAGLLVAACADDAKLTITSSPVAPVLNAPSQKTTAYRKDSAAYVLSLDSTGIAETFICSAANYGVKTLTTYSLQIDKSGNNFANPLIITSATTDTLNVSIAQLYNLLTNPTPSGFGATVGIKTSYDVRIMTTIGASLQPIYSNVKILIINPLPSLKPFNSVNPNLWYIIGLGDGAWNYSASGIGVSMFPLSGVAGNAYTSAGDGTFTYTGYFQTAKGFKIVSGKASDMGTWNVQWGNSDADGINNLVFKNSSSKNLKVPADGYYTITLNSITNTLSIVATTAPTKSYDSMSLPGDFNGWASNPMKAFGTTNNHQWYTTATIAATGGFKFNSGGTWWGGNDFPHGFVTTSGGNIPDAAGTYTVLFNDIDACYYFIK